MSRADDLLHAYLRATDEESEKVLAGLCAESLLPVCLRVVHSRLWRHHEDVQDVAQDVLLKLIRRLREIRVSGAHASIRDPTAWAIGAASRACSDYLRKEHPLRTHLAVVLRYRFEKSVVFSMWKVANGRMVCGWRKCRAVPPLSEVAFQQVLALPRVCARLAGIEPEYSLKLWRALSRVFACASGPIYFQPLVSELLSRSTGGRDDSTCGLDVIAEPASDVRADDPVIQKTILKTLWEAILTLSFEERCALLLNLRGPEGLAVWWRQEVVVRGEVAGSLGLAPEELDRLPLTDLEIAERLQLKEPQETKRRQRVINLRRAAKRQLSEYLDMGRNVLTT